MDLIRKTSIFASFVFIFCMPLFVDAANKNMPPSAPPPDVPAVRPDVLPPSESHMKLLPVENLPKEALGGIDAGESTVPSLQEESTQTSSRTGSALPYALITVIALVLIGVGGLVYLRRNNLS